MKQRGSRAGGNAATRDKSRYRPLLIGIVIVGLIIVGAVLLVCIGIGGAIWWFLSPTSFPEETETYAQARKNFQTKLIRKQAAPQQWQRAVPPANVDDKRLCIAGHSVGGTLTLLTAMTSDRFRAAASFSGSPDQIAWSRGQPELVPFDPADNREFRMRSPLAFPRSFRCPTRLYYGTQEILFSSSSQKTAQLAKTANLDVEAVPVAGDHFSSVPPAMAQCVAFFQERTR